MKTKDALLHGSSEVELLAKTVMEATTPTPTSAKAAILGDAIHRQLVSDIHLDKIQAANTVTTIADELGVGYLMTGDANLGAISLALYVTAYKLLTV